MQNELKPCPFCGGKIEAIERDGYAGGEYITEIECNVCHMHVENLYNNDKTIDLWNTRQPAFDWKPIEELSREPLTNISDLVIYNRNSGIYVIPNIWVIKGVILISEYDYENKRPIEDIQRKYTHYALITPPEE